MKNDYLPTLVAFVAVVLGISYAPVPLWFKTLTVLSGIVMMIISAAVVVGSKERDEAGE